ncbi:MAG: hypothetical protein ACERKX_07455 [Anaerolineales bacterium]
MRTRTIVVSMLTFILVLILTACGSDSSQPPDGEEPAPDIQPVEDPILVVESERLVTDIIGDERALRAMISPDGSAIAWITQSGGGNDTTLELCVYTFTNAASQCTPFPESFLGLAYQLMWSPDSSQIAFTENPISEGLESDIWLFTVDSGAFENRTDDGSTGAWRGLNADEFILDYLPMWNKADGSLYFFRSAPTMNLEFTLEVFRLPGDSGEPERVANYSELFTLQLLYFDDEFFYMDGVASISPDGKKIAFLMSSFQNVPDVPANGLWVADLEVGNDTAAQFADTLDFQAALPAWQTAPASPVGLAWSADSAEIVVLAMSTNINLTIAPIYTFDSASGDMTPVVDFSGYEDVDSYLTEPGPAGLSAAYYSPFTTASAPENARLMLYNNYAGVSAFFVDELPPDEMPPQFTYETTLPGVVTITRTSTSTDGKLLVAGLMLTIVEP